MSLGADGRGLGGRRRIKDQKKKTRIGAQSSPGGRRRRKREKIKRCLYTTCSEERRGSVRRVFVDVQEAVGIGYMSSSRIGKAIRYSAVHGGPVLLLAVDSA
jgi:hypothetical protein